jgi:hypothetical protein
MLNPGDRIRAYMHDTPAGFEFDMTDLTTRKHGSMTASVANGSARSRPSRRCRRRARSRWCRRWYTMRPSLPANACRAGGIG